MTAALQAKHGDAYTVETYGNREDWLKARSSFIGASEAAAIFGVSPWASPLSVYASKLGLRDEGETTSHIMELGNALEPHIASRYEKETGNKLEDIGKWTVLRSREHPFIACTLDRVIRAPGCGPGNLEMKAPLFLDEWATDAPKHYQVQGQHQLLVTAFAWGEFAALARSTGVLRRYPMEPHEGFIDELVARLTEFWERTQRGEAPEPDASEATTNALKLLYPEDRGGELALGDDFLRWDAQRTEAAEALKSAEERKAEAENHIRAAIGDAEGALLPDGTRYSWKLQSRKETVVKASSFRVLRRSAAKKGK